VDAIVSEVIYDEKTGKASGVKFIDKDSKEEEFIPSKLVFLNASAIASAAILMNSKSDRFPNGLGNDSGELGRNIMDHHLGSGAGGRIEGYTDKYYKGRRPNGFYIPRYRNLNGEQRPYKRGFGYQGGASRGNWQKIVAELAYGKDLKDAILKPGEWSIGMTGFGEILPDPNNRMELDYDRLDQWGLPTITFYTKFSDNEYQMREDIKNDAVEMLKAMGAKDIYTYDGESQHGIGLGIHEMGTARMGHDPKTSVTNKYNQIHACKNVFMTDGAFMTSANCVNPSLTYMAFAARAANYAAEQVHKGLL
jgi:choline dehydrogenase-like flavoprotein